MPTTTRRSRPSSPPRVVGARRRGDAACAALGVLADRIGAPATIFAGGIACLMAAGWFASKLPALRRALRPIYVDRGIIGTPDVDTGAKTL